MINREQVPEKVKPICMLVWDSIILESVSVPENKIVCYNVDSAMTDARVRMPKCGDYMAY